jgi:hypothetical protein
MRGLWVASWAVRWLRLGSLARAERWLAPLYRLSARIGGARSAMSVTLAGGGGQGCVERRWTIIAERGEGVEIPTLAAEILAADILAGRLAPGARPATDLLTFERYEPLLAKLPVRYETRERILAPPLYARLLGSAWASLPAAVRDMHDFCRDAGAAGQGSVERGGGRLSECAPLPSPGFRRRRARVSGASKVSSAL